MFYLPKDLTLNHGEVRIAGFNSIVLVIGVPDQDGKPVLLSCERDVAPGAKVF